MSVQVWNIANVSVSVYMYLSVSIFPAFDLISVTQKERNDIHYFCFSKLSLVLILCNVGISNEVL